MNYTELHQAIIDGEFDHMDFEALIEIAKCTTSRIPPLKHPAHITRSSALATCTCGREVELSDPLDNHCECGACYNMSGQSVTPSSQCDEQGNPFDYDHDG